MKSPYDEELDVPTLKICTICNHHRQINNVDFCYRDCIKKTNVDLVNGQTTINYIGETIYYCHSERFNKNLNMDACGPEGKFFIHK
jgi:hypothetical protein